MAKKRSKKDKIRAKAHHRVNLTKLDSNEKSSEVILKVKSQTQKTANENKSYLEDIFAYDPKLIFNDLRKTILVVFFILLIPIRLCTFSN